MQMLENEVRIQKMVDHKHIVQVHEVLETTKVRHSSGQCFVLTVGTQRTFMVMELCRGGHLGSNVCHMLLLHGILKCLSQMFEGDELRLGERQVATLIACLCDAIAYLHDNGALPHRPHRLTDGISDVAHRDLKPENILLTKAGEAASMKVRSRVVWCVFNTELCDYHAC